MVIELTGSRGDLVSRELPVDDPKQRKPVIEKAKTVLDWHPAVPLREGLGHTIAYFDNLLSLNTPPPTSAIRRSCPEIDPMASEGLRVR